MKPHILNCRETLRRKESKPSAFTAKHVAHEQNERARDRSNLRDNSIAYTEERQCLYLKRQLQGLANSMPDQSLPPTIFHMLEKNLGKEIRVILDSAYGFEGTLAAVTTEPAGIWLSDAEAVTLRATIAQPIPQVASREERSEIFLHLNSVQRIEVLHAPSRSSNRS